MKKVLVICDIFPPAFAPRMGYLCKYLPEYGWEPVVIAEYIPQHIYPKLSEHNQHITYVNFYHSNNNFVRKLKYALVFLADFFFGYKDHIMTRIAQRQIKEQNISLILTSSYRTFPLRTACKLSRLNKLPLIVDLRDIIEQFPSNEHISKKVTNIKILNRFIADVLTRKMFRQRNKVLQHADAVTTVSPWHVETLSHLASNVQLIYNGFDPDLFFPAIVLSSTFKITYTGRLMSAALRDPSLLFGAVSNLATANKIDADTFRIQFYTDDESEKILRAIAAGYHIADFIDYFGYVSNHDVPKVLNESSVLLLLTNKSAGRNTPKGIITTKVFEYIAVEKPILCVKSDEGCLAAIIHETKSGIAADNVEQVECFLMEKYAQWKQTGYTFQQTDRQIVGQFSRKEQVKQFIRIFNALTEQ